MLISDPNAYLIIPHAKYQETNTTGKKVYSSKTIHPDTLSMQINVRVRPQSNGESLININLFNIYSKGAYYNDKKLVMPVTKDRDSTTTKVTLSQNKVEWQGVVSTGVLEKMIADYLK